MLSHYLKITFRNLQKFKSQSLIAIFGLAFGVACFVPAAYWLRYETGYDGFLPDSKHIYRIYAIEKQSGKVNERVPGILETKLHEHFPVTETSAGFVIGYENYSAGDIPHVRLQTLYTDSAFFKVFPQVYINGDYQQPLRNVRNIILTETMAERLFGDVENAIGKQIKSTTFSFQPYTVTAVVKDPPPNTNLPFDAIHFPEIQSQMTVYMPEESQWKYFNKQLYVKLGTHTDVEALSGQLNEFTSRLGVNINIELKMLLIGDVRHQLNTDLPFTLDFIRLFVFAGLLLLLSVFFNFLNLYYGIFRQRIHELRQRSVNGATGRHLIMQMTFELTCTAFSGVLLAWGFVVLTRTAFSNLLDIPMETGRVIPLFVVCGMSVIAILLLGGAFPVWRLSRSASCHPAKEKTERQSVSRHIAVSLQLGVSVVFIVATSVVMMQLRFVNTKDLGFDRHDIIQLTGIQGMNREKRNVLMNELRAIPQIENVTATYFEPQHDDNTLTTEVEWEGKSLHEKPTFQSINTDSRFAETFKLQMKQGEWWNEGDRNRIVLNEEAVRVMGLSNPVGAVIQMEPGYIREDGVNPNEEYEVAGVVNDFHTLSLRSRIYPAIFREYMLGGRDILYIRTTPGQEQEVMKRIVALLPGIHATLKDDAALVHLDELYNRLNRVEQTGLKLFAVLAAVCLLISLFGIYAVVVASTQRRRKEIAIRKVYGAAIPDVVCLFLREYVWLVIITGIMTLPVAFWLMNRWLQGYAYHTGFPWWLMFAVIAGLAVVVLLTTLGRVLKAANQNPAEVIKG